VHVEAPAVVRALELEVELAGTPDLYLELTLTPPRLEVSARGMVLDSVDLDAVRLAAPLATTLELPAVWEVAAPSSEPTRTEATPRTLREWPGGEGPVEGTVESPESGDGEADEASDEPPTPPDAYPVELTNGWRLWIGQPPGRSGVGVWLGAVARGWDVLWRRPRDDRPEAILDLAPDHARRLHHLFRPNLKILVRPDEGSVPG
jgi:hypothetical protein